MSADDNWLARQALASATWLAAIPAEVLSPTGRSLRASSSSWLPMLADPTIKAVQGRKGSKGSATSAGDAGRDAPLPLMTAVADE